MERTKVHFFGDNSRFIDDALVVVFCAPNSFTGEDVVELHCHGGGVVGKMVMNQLFAAGAVQAMAGEFTHRAFLSGRVNLTQAEAIGNIVHAKTENALEAAANDLVRDSLAGEIRRIRGQLIELAAELLADMNFSDDNADIPRVRLAEGLRGASSGLEKLKKTSNIGIILQEGLNATIAGAPNVGKSSLLNSILGQERAIVTDVAGTTRDVLREQANILGNLVNFADTAGIRPTDDHIEKIGISHAQEQIKRAELVIVVLDGSRSLNAEDERILRETAGKKRIIAVNKSDKEQILNLPRSVENDVILHISAKNGTGMDELYAEIAKVCGGDENLLKQPIISNSRQKQQVERAIAILSDVNKENVPPDAVLSEIEGAIAALGEIIGENVSEKIIEEIFSKFCIGK
jgi:tRNA modification GTPase